MRPARGERQRRGLRQPVGAGHPAPARERAAVAALQVDNEPGRGADPEEAAAVAVDGIRKLRIHRVVELRIAAGFQTEPDVIGRPGGRGEGEIEGVHRRGERIRRRRPSVVAVGDRLSAGRADVNARRPGASQIGRVRRIQHDVGRRCRGWGARRQDRGDQKQDSRGPGNRRTVQHETPEVCGHTIIQTEAFDCLVWLSRT